MSEEDINVLIVISPSLSVCVFLPSLPAPKTIQLVFSVVNTLKLFF